VSVLKVANDSDFWNVVNSRMAKSAGGYRDDGRPQLNPMGALPRRGQEHRRRADSVLEMALPDPAAVPAGLVGVLEQLKRRLETGARVVVGEVPWGKEGQRADMTYPGCGIIGHRPGRTAQRSSGSLCQRDAQGIEWSRARSIRPAENPSRSFR
jgi:hypothetical protein